MDLKGKCVLILSPEASSASWVRKIEQREGQAILFPTIEIERIEFEEAALEAGITKLSAADWVIALSQQAIHALPPSWRAIIQQNRPNLTAIGPATRAALLEMGVSTTIDFPDGSTSETLLDAASFQANEIQGRRIVLLSGEGGRTTLLEVLTERGAIVDKLPLYRRILPIKPKLTLDRILMWGVNVICVTSAETLENLLLLTESNAHPFLKSQFVLVLSERLKTHAIQMGFKADQIDMFKGEI